MSLRIDGRTPSKELAHEGALLAQSDPDGSMRACSARSIFRSGVEERRTMRVFIAGATGVIGSRAVRRLVAAGHAVTGVARSDAARGALERAGAEAVNVDLFNLRAVRAAVEGYDAVINLATHVPRGRVRLFWPRAWAETNRLRHEASWNLAQGAIGAGAGVFVQESFGLTYPDGGDDWVTEDVELRPARYNRAVNDAEASVERFTQAGGRGIALRFASLYGPSDFPTDQLLKSVKHGIFPILGRPEAFFPMVHHDDASSAVMTALHAPAGAYNVVDDEPMRRRDLAIVMADLLDVRRPRLLPAWLASIAGSVGKTMSRSERLSNRKLRAAGWAPSYPSAREGLRAIVTGRRGMRPWSPVPVEGHPAR
jgi:nucleoside-diphosphate-sugar epimerase